jgi:1,4-alpha-glucan branching enzyme
VYLFHEGSLFHSYRMLGAQLVTEKDGTSGVLFTVWAPHAREARVVGDFNSWNGQAHEMHPIQCSSGLWSLFIPGLDEGTVYKYELITASGQKLLKADPYAFFSERRPNTASIVADLSGYRWNDADWQRSKAAASSYEKPMSIYEVHFGSWRVGPDGRFLTYRELADRLVDYAVEMGYTHLELLPLSEHPFDRSWGYQITGFFSVTSRFGTPHDFMYFVDRCHQRGIGVIMDWVPGHFCKDDHGLRLFDGTPLYEYAHPLKAEKPEWGTLTFDYGRPEVVSFLISNALFWMDVYHIDGLRIDAVASMLYLNFGRHEQLVRNEHGGPENLEAIAFLKKLNETVFAHYPNALMIAEDSTDWPLVCTPTDKGGLGFNYKWNMGWMNDTLRYMKLEPEARKAHHHLLTFSFMYAWSENYVLPLSHDEVVHGKKSLLDKMPGDYWRKFANLRLLYGYMTAHPGKKLNFMGGEFGQFHEWKDLEGDQQDWHLLDYQMHSAMQRYVRDLNQVYQSEEAFWIRDHRPDGFEWIDPDNAEQSVISFIRRGSTRRSYVIVICNFTPYTYGEFRVGVPHLCEYQELFNSDLEIYGGSGHRHGKALIAEKIPWHLRHFSVTVKLPPLAVLVLKPKYPERGNKN